ncbi:MAG: DUF3710 domain-containing protein [Demequinaceae bacterium]|nr:DUF3710 domain-containing protein [Demequinaceae bacterium]
MSEEGKAPAKKAPAAKDSAPTVPPLPDLGRADGPWSLADAPADQAFVSFGPLKVPAFPTLHANLQIDVATKRPGAVAIGMEDGSIQLQVYAAPRGAGLWGDVRRAMARKVVMGRGTAQAVEGDFGPELVVNRPIPVGGRLVGNLVSRCVGIEGDRWMLRAVVGGRNPLTDECVAKVNNLLSHCAVDRGEEPLTPGTIMPLAFPVGGSPVETTEMAPEPGEAGTGDDA